MKRAASKVFDKQPEKKHEGMAMPLALKICRVPSTVPNLPWLKQGRVFPSRISTASSTTGASKSTRRKRSKLFAMAN